MKQKTILNRCIKLLCLLLCVVLLSSVATEFCRYYDQNSLQMTGFYAEPRNTLDVVLIGASEVTAGYSAAYAYDLYGFTSYPYSLENSAFPLYRSQLTEILNRQDPRWIVVDINAVLLGDGDHYKDDIRQLRYLHNIPCSWNRLKTILEEVPSENWYYFLFPLAKTHSNWKEAWSQRETLLEYHKLRQEGSVLKGTLTYTNAHAPEASVLMDVSRDTSELPMGPESEGHLCAFLDHCRKEHVDNVIFVRFPHAIVDQEGYDRFRRGAEAGRIIRKYGYPYIDMEQKNPVPGLNVTADFYDGDHMNIYGQQKLTRYLGGLLAEKYGVEESRLTPEQRSQWEQSAEYIQRYYRFCSHCMEEGVRAWVGEYQWVIQALEEMNQSA